MTSDDYEIESDIPIPPARWGGGRPKTPVYPFSRMEVGDSFLVPVEKTLLVMHAARGRRKRTHEEYATRQVDGGLRIWRIK